MAKRSKGKKIGETEKMMIGAAVIAVGMYYWYGTLIPRLNPLSGAHVPAGPTPVHYLGIGEVYQ